MIEQENYEYKVETLPLEDFNEWVEHCGSIFEVGPAYFRRHFVSDPHKDYNSVFIIRNSESKIVSTVRVFHRQVYLGGKTYKMGGIGEVSTKPEYRRLGLSSRLLNHAENYMRENEFDLSMLSTGNFSHYAKHGFARVNSYAVNIAVTGEFRPDDIRPLSEEDFHDMSVLYNRYCSKLNCCIVRTRAYWKLWCKEEIKNPYGLFKDGRLAGYICFDGNRVTEIAAEESDYDILIQAVKNTDGEIDEVKVPRFIKTSREIISEECYSGNMICVYKPVEIGGIIFKDTESLVGYLNDYVNGGIIQWKQDGF